MLRGGSLPVAGNPLKTAQVWNGRRLLAIAAISVSSTVPVATPAQAHGGIVGQDLHVAASLGDRELTVVIRRTGQVPGPLRVDVVNRADSRGGVLRIGASALTAVSAGNETDVRLADGGGMSGGVLRVDRAGAWELWVRDDGRETARIPFVVPEYVTPAWEWTTNTGYGAAGVLLLAALAAAAAGRRRWPPFALGGGAVAAVVMATTAALLSPTIPAPEIDPLTGRPADPRAVPAVAARPHANLLVGAALTAGERSAIDLRLVDGATGYPVDDLVVHHDALVHLVIIGPGDQFAHLHPVRTAPGTFRVWFRASSGGDHRVYAELERSGAGGVQVVGATVPAAGPAAAGSALPGLGIRAAASGMSAEVRASALVAGEPSVLTIELTEDGRPVEDLQPWLGMAGHLITAGPDGTLGHVHAAPAGSPSGTSVPDETVAGGGPRVRFVYAFPSPGRHRLWFQVQRGYRLVTVPVQVDVRAPGTGAGS